MSDRGLAAGTYFVAVDQLGGDTTYRLTLTSTAVTVSDDYDGDTLDTGLDLSVFHSLGGVK